LIDLEDGRKHSRSRSVRMRMGSPGIASGARPEPTLSFSSFKGILYWSFPFYVFIIINDVKIELINLTK